jgi:hypothetical protein
MDNEYSSRGGNPPLSWNQKKRHQKSQAARNSRYTSKKHQAKRQAIAYDVVRAMNEREFGVIVRRILAQIKHHMIRHPEHLAAIVPLPPPPPPPR